MAIGLGAALLPGLAFAGPKLTQIPAADFSRFAKLDQAVSGSDTVHVTLGLSGFHKDWADRFVADIHNPNSPNFHHWITTDEFGQYFGASDSDIAALTQYLTSEGFCNINIAAGKNFISADGTFDQAASAFHTGFANFVRPANLVDRGEPDTIFAPTQPITLPESLASKVSCVCGLDNLAIQHPMLAKAKSKVVASRRSPINGYLPSQMAKAYDTAPYVNSHPGHDMKIAVYSPTARYKNDPQDFATRLGISQNFTITDNPVKGGNSGLGGAEEAALDAEVILGQANHAQIFMVECPKANEADAFDWVGKRNDIPIISSSWDGYESEYIVNGQVTGFPAVFESTCETLAGAGITIFVASGDAAWFGGSGVQSVTMESSCPYVTSVGGTAVTLNSNNTWKSETLWSYNGVRSKPAGGGGGESQIFKRPTWQTFNGPSNSFVDGFRMIPDVSANASNIINYCWYLVFNGNNTEVGGTSAATPLWASNLLLMEQNWGDDGAKSARVGCINPTLYTMGNYYENPSDDLTLATIFHDITVGSNGHFNCTTGWDLCSGWGSSDFGRLWTDASYLMGFNSLSPDLQPHTPNGWAHPLVISASKTSQTEPSSFEHGVTYYLSAGAENSGTADAPAFPFSVVADGKTLYTDTFKSVPINGDIQWSNLGTIVFISKGTHTITYKVNAGGKIKEANQSNNTYTRTITVK
jgi:kumamolisin